MARRKIFYTLYPPEYDGVLSGRFWRADTVRRARGLFDASPPGTTMHRHVLKRVRFTNSDGSREFLWVSSFGLSANKTWVKK